MKTNEINILIERYFEATATAEEEAELMKLLADPATERSHAVEEARAVMGFTAVQRAVNRRTANRRPHRTARWIAAASVAAAVAVVALIGWHISDGSNVETAATIYAHGEVNHSTDLAMDIMAAQLGAMGEANENSPASAMLEALEAMNEK